MCLFFKKILFASGDTRCSCSKTTVLFMLIAKSLAYSRYAEKETEKVVSQTKDKVKHGGYTF